MYRGAIVGVGTRCGQSELLVYDRDLCIQWLIRYHGGDYSEAQEFFDFNTAGSWNGEHTPIILERPE
jgi:hypothetical protein